MLPPGIKHPTTFHNSPKEPNAEVLVLCYFLELYQWTLVNLELGDFDVIMGLDDTWRGDGRLATALKNKWPHLDAAFFLSDLSDL